MVRLSQSQSQVMKRVRKETRERRSYHLCRERRERLLFEQKVIEEAVKSLKHGLLHCKYLSGQLVKEMHNTDAELRQRGLKIQVAKDYNSGKRHGICIPFVDYDFDILRFALGSTLHGWVGSHRYFIYMLVSKHFRMVTMALCPLSHDPQRCRLHVGNCVSSLALTASTAKRHHMCRKLCARMGDPTPLFATWIASTVHTFRILAGPQEMRSLHILRPSANPTWLVVPHLPWKVLFENFHISPQGSFLSKRRRLKRVLIDIHSFSVDCRAALWRF